MALGLPSSAYTSPLRLRRSSAAPSMRSRSTYRPSRPLLCLTTAATPHGQKHHEHNEYDHERLDNLIGSHHAFSCCSQRGTPVGLPVAGAGITRHARLDLGKSAVLARRRRASANGHAGLKTAYAPGTKRVEILRPLSGIADLLCGRDDGMCPLLLIPAASCAVRPEDREWSLLGSSFPFKARRHFGREDAEQRSDPDWSLLGEANQRRVYGDSDGELKDAT
jgi:hypothetical protein